MLPQGLVANQQNLAVGVPKVSTKQMDGGGVVPHNFIDDEVGGHSQGFHKLLPLFLLYLYYSTSLAICQGLFLVPNKSIYQLTFAIKFQFQVYIGGK